MNQCIAFEGTRRIALGELANVVESAKKVIDQGEHSLLILDAITSRPIEIDFRGTVAEVLARLSAAKSAETTPSKPKPRGRPRLGVIPREVTLLPRHWDWLATQPGGASVALRRLVEEARKTNAPQDQKREAQESTHRFMTALAGDLPGYEEALRALYAGDSESFKGYIRSWPTDIQTHALTLSKSAISVDK